jgi:hypothetical protein
MVKKRTTATRRFPLAGGVSKPSAKLLGAPGLSLMLRHYS